MRQPLPLRAARRAARSIALLSLPAALRRVPTMLGIDELRMLHGLGKRHWANRGAIVDAGCFLGGSTMALGTGLVANPALNAAVARPVIETYDLFEIEEWTIGQFFPDHRKAKESFFAEWQANVAPLGDLVRSHPGDVTAERWDDRPIEILFIDLAKHWIVNDHVVRTFFPALVPGVSVVVQQDYLYTCWNGWLAVTMEVFADYFSISDTALSGSVVFRYDRQIPRNLIDGDVFASLSRSEIRRLMTRAIGRFSGHRRKILEASAAHLETVLDGAVWPDV